MKRYLVFAVSFDTRSQVLALEVKDDWEEKIRHLWIENKQQIVNGLAQEYGIRGIDQKVTNLSLGESRSLLLHFTTGSFANVVTPLLPAITILH